MKDVIQIEDQYYILATSDRAADQVRVLKEGDTFALFDTHGDVQPFGLGEQGIFHEGTRYLSKTELRLAGVRPLLLGSDINKRNELLAVDMMNPDVMAEGKQIRRDSIHIYRSKFIWQGSCFEQLRITNFSLEPLAFPITMSFFADFADIFEVRGAKRSKRGLLQDAEVETSSVRISYAGLDGVMRTTRISFSPQPSSIIESEVRYRLSLQPKESVTIRVTVTCECGDCKSFGGGYETAIAETRDTLLRMKMDNCDITTDNEHFNALLDRSLSDLIMMMTRSPSGVYPYAGVPWFSTQFGRDGIITALEMLWINPDVARGVLSFLALTQADEMNAERDAQPGKILHETRLGEMAALGEIPFGRYYGSVDSTPLFVLLAGAYYERTSDLQFVESIWENVKRALKWIDVYGDADGDGFVEYARTSHQGLLQQGWKDSNDSVFHADGTLAEAPIALCEVQGYVYEAKVRGAELAEAVGDRAMAVRLVEEAAVLRERFQEKFWCDDISFYALALDGSKNPCRVRSSNAGHLLFSGIVPREHADRMASQLLSESFFSGWGIRTVASGEFRYNPMSYHNGSIWPHDNAVIAYGLSRYGFTRSTLSILEGIFAASLGMDLHRLPELFCGFKRRDDSCPILYPMACAPQAWAAASIYMLLQGCMGMTIDARKNKVCFEYPLLPSFLGEIRIRNIRVVNSTVDVLLKRFDEDVTVSVLRKTGPVEVMILK